MEPGDGKTKAPKLKVPAGGTAQSLIIGIDLLSPDAETRWITSSFCTPGGSDRSSARLRAAPWALVTRQRGLHTVAGRAPLRHPSYDPAHDASGSIRPISAGGIPFEVPDVFRDAGHGHGWRGHRGPRSAPVNHRSPDPPGGRLPRGEPFGTAAGPPALFACSRSQDAWSSNSSTPMGPRIRCSRCMPRRRPTVSGAGSRSMRPGPRRARRRSGWRCTTGCETPASGSWG